MAYNVDCETCKHKELVPAWPDYEEICNLTMHPLHSRPCPKEEKKN